MTALKRRKLEDLRIRNYAPTTVSPPRRRSRAAVDAQDRDPSILRDARCEAEGRGSSREPPNQFNAAARIKILDPVTSLGPSGPAHLLKASAQSLHIRVPRSVLIGALVHVRSAIGLAFGQVRYCIPVGAEFQIGVKLEPMD
jgi:hypothetical protein